MAKGFRGGGFGGKSPMGGMNRSDLMKQAQKMQEEMLKTQEELENRTYKATAEVSGKRLITSLVIDPDAVDPDDVEMLQDMIIAAVNSALSEAEKTSSETMSRLTGGLNLGF